MLKFLLGFLLFANVVLFAVNAGYLGAGNLQGREPARMENQLNAQSIRLQRAASAAGAVPGTPASGASPGAPDAAGVNAGSAGGGTDVSADASGLSSNGTPAVAQVATALGIPDPRGKCVEIGNFDTGEAQRFNLQLAPLALGERLTRRSVPEIARYIVYIPPLPDKESADRKGAELRQLGVQDFYVLTDNSELRWGISLGMFRSAEAAELHLASLTQMGVRSGRVAARPGTGNRIAFQMRGLDDGALAAIERIRLGFPRQSVRACAPP